MGQKGERLSQRYTRLEEEKSFILKNKKFINYKPKVAFDSVTKKYLLMFNQAINARNT